jgi:hypothetical protein
MSDLTKKINLVGRFATLSKTVDFEDFYSINVWVHRDEISLQGHINPTTLSAAKKLGINLVFENDCQMLKGETEDGKLRIVLT